MRASHTSRGIKFLLSCQIVKWGNPEREFTSKGKYVRWCSQSVILCCKFAVGLKGWESSGSAPSQSHRALIVQQSYKGEERCRTLLLPPAVEWGPYLFKTKNKNKRHKPPKFPYVLLIPLYYPNTDMIKSLLLIHAALHNLGTEKRPTQFTFIGSQFHFLDLPS